MSQDDWKSRIEKAAVDIVWSHWIKLGAYVEGKCCQASGDPEALILLTAIMAKKDLRLIEIMGQWLQHYESIVNVERLKTALKLLPKDQHVQNLYTTLKKVLRESVPVQAWKRWNKIFSVLDEPEPLRAQPDKSAVKTISRKKLQTHDWILERNTLLGFRYVLGVTAKADILYFLSVYSNQQQVTSARPATGAHIARMLHYDPATVLRALEELKDARLILCDESSADKVYTINSQCPHFSWPPKADRFFLDWLTLFPIFMDVISLDEVSSYNHESIILDRLNARLQALDEALNMFPRPNQKRYSKDNFVGVDQQTMCDLYAQALYEIGDALKEPRHLDWGSDELTRFLDAAQRNLWASYAYLDKFRVLMAMDQVFLEATSLLSHHKNWFEGLFVTRCHSAFRAAIRLSGSGQLSESFALMRASLENALYAFHIHCNPELGNIWMQRKDDLKSKQACKKGFIITNILNDYEKHDPYNGAPARKLYEHTIDYGAHPNADSFYPNLEFKDDEKGRTILTLQLNTNELPLKHALVNSARTGGCCLLIFENIYRDRFQSSGLSEKLRNIIHGL